MHTHSNSPRRFAVACMAAAVLASAARADIDLKDVPPPQPAPVQAKTYLGESVDIPLSGVSRSGNGLQFVIRRQPSLGTLSPIRMTGPNTAVVTYTHNRLAGTGVDRFRYAVGAQGIGVSTPAEAVITISERPAIFVAPTRLDFPNTIAGRAAFQTFELRNEGGGTIDGKLTVPAPWVVVDGDGSYSLGPGGVQSITISFAPSEARSYSGSASFSHAPETGIVLAGQGFYPVEAVPREIRLGSDGRHEARTGDFLLRNVSDEDFDLRIKAPREVVVQDSIHLPAHTEQSVALHTRAGFLAGAGGAIKITGKSVALELPLQIMPAPERIVVQPAKIDFGTLNAGRTGRAKFTVRNTGGSPADLSVQIPPGASLSPDPASAKLAPGASQEFEVRFSRPLPGEFAGQLVFEAGESTAKLELAAKFLQQWQTPKGGVQSPRAAEIVYSDIPPVMQIGVTRQTRTELDLAWKKAAPNITGYALYMRTITFDTKGVASFRYEKLDRVKPRFIRDEVRVTLAGLRPGESVTLCVVGFDANGVPTRPSPPLTIATLPKPVFHVPWLWICVIVLIVLSVLIVREHRRRRATSDADFVARLEGMKN